jgi:hypothetical protein
MKINTFTPDPNAIGRTKIIQDIITKMQLSNTFLDANSNPVNWIEQYYGLARVDEVNGKNFPVILDASTNDYIPMSPNDNLRSMAFFYDEGVGTYDNSQTLSYTFNMIVWYNKDLIDKSGHAIIDHFIRETQTHLRKAHCELDQVFIGRDNVYQQFPIPYFEERYMHSPYNAFRIRFTAIEQCDSMSNGQKFNSSIVVN